MKSRAKIYNQVNYGYVFHDFTQNLNINSQALCWWDIS